jgi:hypothetical protein
MLLHDLWVIREIKEEMKKFLEFVKNESTTYKNLWDSAKAIIKEKFIAISVYIKNTEKSQIKD